MAPGQDEIAEVWNALVLATRDYVEKNGFHQVVIGLSGGVDSSLVAGIAVDALGLSGYKGIDAHLGIPVRVEDDAAALAANLGIALHRIPIEAAHTALTDMLDPLFRGHEPDLTEENLQSRIAAFS